MTLIRFNERQAPRNPWAEMEKMRREMEMIWPRFFGNTTTGASVYPALNISEDPTTIYVRAEIPGTPAEAISIFVEGDSLTIRGERKEAATPETISYHRQEIGYGRFNRAVTLPTRINAEKVTATAQDGILTITLPKAEEAMPRQITVTSS